MVRDELRKLDRHLKARAPTIKALEAKLARWIDSSPDPTSPPQADMSFYLKSENDLQNLRKIQIEWSGVTESTPSREISVPAEKRVEFEKLVSAVKKSASYEDGIAILKKAMISAGIIQHYPVLKLRHASSQPPEVFAKEGILSASELERRGIAVDKKWGQRVGDGVYTIGSEKGEWDQENSWGNHQYLITYRDVWVAHNNNFFANSFMELYRLHRKKWGKSITDGYDGQMAVGMVGEFMASMKWAYEDFGLSAASFGLEVLIKTKIVPRENIQYLGSRR